MVTYFLERKKDEEKKEKYIKNKDRIESNFKQQNSHWLAGKIINQVYFLRTIQVIQDLTQILKRDQDCL